MPHANLTRTPGFSSRPRKRSALHPIALALLVASVTGSALAGPQPFPDVFFEQGEGPIAPPPSTMTPGQGLCGAIRTTPNPGVVFPATNANRDGVEQFATAANNFMDLGGGVGTGKRFDATLQTKFDLSNSVILINNASKGDYIDSDLLKCPPDYMENGKQFSSGCPFPGSVNNVPQTLLERGFGSRFRGFVNVPVAWTFTIHFGFYSDDAVVVRIWGAKPRKDARPTDPPQLIPHILIGRPAGQFDTNFRVTNGIRFPAPGLYPIEILHAQYGQAAALEFAVLPVADFDDYDQVPRLADPPLPTQRFALDATTPDRFFQTNNGALSVTGSAELCQQCPRDSGQASVPYVDDPITAPENRVCPLGDYCNEAAVCAPCIGDRFCGDSCQECKDTQPYCVLDPTKATMKYKCVQCREDADCGQGLVCVQGSCINPCNCCPDAPHCVETDSKAHPGVRNCSECRTASDCGEGRTCDLINARCVDKLPECRDDDRCGAGCVNCREISKDEPNGPRPYCLYGQTCVQCRFDYDCKAGSYCRSGDCVPCTHDRHCGASCKSCGIAFVPAADGMDVDPVSTDKPFCLTPNGEVDKSTCVRCLTDAQCGEGGKCNPSTHECENKCQTACEPGLLCDGNKCVQCLTSSQCPCGKCVDGSCTEQCADTTDCNSMQCCQRSTGMCVREKCGPGTAAGGALCCGVGDIPTEPAGGGRSRGPLLGLLGALALLGGLHLRRRRQRPVVGG